MNRKHLMTIAVAGIAAGCAGIGVPVGTGYLAYGIPPTTRAIYEIVDTIVTEGTTPEGEANLVTSASSVTLLMNFWSSTGVGGLIATDFSRSASLSVSGGKMRARGRVRSFEATRSRPAARGVSADLDDVTGDLEVRVGRRGLDELASFPAVPGAAANDHLFPTLGHALFPRLPDVWVEPGDSWVDTVTVPAAGEGSSPATTLISTYTLGGDSLVHGLMLVHITVASEVTVEGVGEEPGMPVTGNVTGTVNGSVLWDPERRIVAYAEYHRDFLGTTTGRGGTSQPAWTITGPTRIWRTR